ncbi:PRL-1 phosphatase-like [Eriocheir sinensis]|uniref:PRL-1 phosphatase-like n=1 Tax=Eriocheir sinensis TaxID=95602 RepID=UPI0021C9D2B3|nr:PRL-1 phosphatase-like [Eriocheir sinensis]XP_050740549.1 PRL-1 phosphatase-like [Eriocheir sinensis]
MSANSANMRSKSIRPAPSEIEYKNMRFLITDRPTDATMQSYIEELMKHGVHDVVRVCEPTYKTDELKKAGISVIDLVFDDGTFPPAEVVEEWLSHLRVRHREEPGCTIAVHCVAGLGRAPVLVAIALIELGQRYEDAVELIRQKRRGAINAKQLAYLEKYRPKSRLRLKNGHKTGACCVQ